MLALLPSAPPVAHPSITRRNTSNTAAPARPLPPSAVASSSSTTRPSSSSITPTPTAPVQPAAPAPAPAQISIHNYPSAELLRLLASLLTQIAQANDKLQAPDSPHPVPSPAALATRPLWHTLTTASRGSLASQTSPLAFHARTVPTISLHAYLARIHKYCPAPNDVFLALLVYFDRMARLSADATGRAFVIDSFNVHRLVIAGVTVASKFFSDVFYTNSRYAKVGGLPQSELNQLELQFLLLNDFRLRVSDDEMQHY
ncbi:cyclin-domain-containing protein, partial [Peniophora sp. CONT]